MYNSGKTMNTSGAGNIRFRFFLFILIIILLTGVRISAEEKTITLATWNIRKFSDNSRSVTELETICSILQHYDFIAIQEVHDQSILDRTTRVLNDLFGKEYEYVLSPLIGDSMHKEGYAFLYDSNRIFWKDTGELMPDPKNRYTREPFYADFQAGEFDFYAINFHAVWGETKAERQMEAEMLAVTFWTLQNKDTEDDIILMGDFNLPPTDPVFDDLKTVLGVFPVNNVRPTTIRDKLYDNIWLQMQFCIEFTGNWGVYHFDELLFNNDDAAANLAVSDHRPVWIEMNISGPDDD